MGNEKKNIEQSVILKLIGAGYSSTQIARELGLSKPSITYHTNKMKEAGLIEFKKEGIVRRILLTSKGARGVVDVSNKLPTKRFHAYGLRYQRLGTLKGQLEPAKMFSEAREANVTITTLKNTTQVTIKADITTKLTTQSLILYAPSLYYHRGAPAITMEAEAKKVLDEVARAWVDKLDIKLRCVRPGVLWSEVIQEEIADEGHELGKAAVPDGGQVVLARHSDGKARLTGDWSTKKQPELEAVHRASAGEDSDTIDRQFSSVLNGELNLLDINKLKDMALEQEAKYNRQFEIVNKLTKQVELHLRIMEKIDRKLSQRTLKEFQQVKI